MSDLGTGASVYVHNTEAGPSTPHPSRMSVLPSRSLDGGPANPST